MNTDYICPKCGSELQRTKRSRLDKFLGIFTKKERYRCYSFGYNCDYTGLRLPKPKTERTQ